MNVGRSTEDHSDCCENENDGDLPLLGANSNDSSPDASLHPSNERRDDRTHTNRNSSDTQSKCCVLFVSHKINAI